MPCSLRRAGASRFRQQPALLAALFAATVASLGGPATAGAATMTFAATEDARVEQLSPSQNFGTYKLAGNAKPVVRSYIKFPVTGLTGSVVSAKLRIFPNTASTTGFQVRGAASSWSEMNITWANAPGIGGSVAASGAYSCCAGYVEVDATPLVAANGAVTVVLTTTGPAAEYRSREWGSSYVPQLIVSTADPSPAPAATRYVSPTGSDTNDGSSAAPWRTVAKAASSAPAGSSVVIMGGNYAEDVTFSTPGTASSPTSFAANGSDAVTVRSMTLKASNLTVRGMNISGATGHCVTIAPALTGVTLRGNRISACGRSGIAFTRPTTQAYTRDVLIAANTIARVGMTSTDGNDLTVYGDNVTVEDNDLTGAPNDAINMWGDGQIYRRNRIHDIVNTVGNHNDAFQTWTGTNDGAEGHPVTRLVIERNIVENIGGPNAHCLMAEGPGHSDWTIQTNLFRNIGDQCLIFGKAGNGNQGIQAIKIAYNTYVAAGANNTIEFNLTSSGALASNVFYNCKGYSSRAPYYVATAASVTSDYNLSGGGSPKLAEPHGKNADPLFADASAGNFHLTAASPAVNSGDNGALVNPIRSVDLDGIPTQAAGDIGAYEYR